MYRLWGLGLALVVLGTACATKPSARKLETWTRSVDPSLSVELTPERVARGAYLVGTIGACAVCHNGREPLAEDFSNFDDYTNFLGGFRMTNPSMGDKFALWIPNLTPHESGLADWSDDEVLRALRDGIRPDGERLFPFMPFMQYQHMSDGDARAVVAFLRTTAPVDSPDRRTENQIPGLFEMMMAGVGHAPVGSVPDPDPDDPKAVGAYLVHIGHCGECHAAAMSPRGPDHDKWLAGSAFPFKEPTGKYPAPNLTPSDDGIAGATVGDIVEAIQTCRNLDGTPMLPPMSMFCEAYRLADREDLEAIGTYLTSLAPVKGKAIAKKVNEVGVAWLATREQELEARAEAEAAEAAKQAARAAAAAAEAEDAEDAEDDPAPPEAPEAPVVEDP